LGASVVEVELNYACRDLGEAENLVLKYEFKAGLNKYLASANAKVKSLEEVISFNWKNEKQAMPFFKQERLEDSHIKGGLDSKEYTDALAKSKGAAKIIDDMLLQNRLDAIAGTSMGLPCCIDLVNGDYDTGFYFSSPAAMAGYPHITVPMGRVNELPVGLSFIAGAYKEMDLLNYAYAFEQATKFRTVPKFLASVK
jgi:amidase